MGIKVTFLQAINIPQLDSCSPSSKIVDKWWLINEDWYFVSLFFLQAENKIAHLYKESQA